MREIRSLTSLRGVGALWVAIGHLSWTLPPEGLIAVFPFIRMGYLAVDFFFILSGFVLTLVFFKDLNTFSIKEFLVRRVFRIVPTHLVILLLFGIFVFIYGIEYVSPEKYSGINFIKSIFLVQSFTDNRETFFSWNYPSWSLVYELWIFPVVILTVYFLRRFFKYLAAIPILPLVILIVYILVTQDAEFLSDVHTIQGALLRCIPECLSGSLLAISIHQGKHTVPHGLLVSFLGVASIVSTYLTPQWIFIPIWIVFLYFVISYLAKNDLPILSRFGLYYLGLWSYSIYLVHGPIERFMRSLPIPQHMYFLAYVLYTLAFIALGALSYYTVEKWSIRTGKRIVERTN